MNMKVLQINTVAVNGSTGRITEGIGEAIIRRGHSSYIAYGRNNILPESSKSNLIKIGNNFSVTEHVLETRLLDRQGLASRYATHKFIKQIDAIKPDVIHLHNIHGNFLNYKILFKYLAEADIPVVWTLHDCWAFTGHCVHFVAKNCDKWKSGCFSCPRLGSYPKSYFADRSRSNYENKKRAFTSVKNMTLVPVSNWLGQVCSESFLGNNPIHVIHNGIDTDSFSPKINVSTKIRNKYELGNRFVVLGVATGWSNENGLYDFIELRKRLDPDYVIVLVGVTEKIKSILPEGIIGISRTDSKEELAELYSTADIFINGSFEETFGLVTAESMACGTPVIVYDSTACPEIVTDNTGYVIPVRDIEAMKSTIEYQRQLPYETKLSQSEVCSELIRNKYDRLEKYDEYVSLYEQIISENN